jgi:SAM-dependent MidA family methyltransferase
MLQALIEQEIRERGPLRFDRFMELALYHPELGYYRRRDRDPFGARGDFYTASQLQPVFGRVIARAIGDLREQMGSPDDFTVIELGPGRREMAKALQDFRYIAVEYGAELPSDIIGVVFSNEFFDALPVRWIDRRGAKWRERMVTILDGKLAFVEGSVVGGGPYVGAQQQSAELHTASRQWLERIAYSLKRGFVLTIDYGYTKRELLRFPQGTLMSYRKHQASDDVLSKPGECDITSHVPFDLLRHVGRVEGLDSLRFETLSQLLLRVGERDQFAEIVAGGHELQLKTLLFGMGETFRVLLQSKEVRTKRNRPRSLGAG